MNEIVDFADIDEHVQYKRSYYDIYVERACAKILLESAFTIA